MDRVKAPARPKVTRPTAQQLHECPGGAHEAIEFALGEVLGQLDVLDETVGVAPVGCALLLFESLDVDIVTVPPGRGPTVAAGLKRVHPRALVFTYQGGWDATCAGAGEILHAAARNEPIAVIFANRVRTAAGAAAHGMPPLEHELDLCELARTANRGALIERLAVGGEEDLPALKEALARAFEAQRGGQGFSMLEITPREPAAGPRRKPGCPDAAAAR